MIIWAIIPVKPLRDSKSRLAHILTPDQRAEFTGYMLKRTLTVIDQVPAIDRSLVISRDQEALKIARQQGASTYGESEKQDLNMALTRATHVAAAQKANCVLILPADLPFVTVADIEMLIDAVSPDMRGSGGNGYYYLKRAIAICSDHNQDGTNALLICQPAGFTFQYGPGSFQRHLTEAERLGMDRHITDAPGIKFDLDTEEDWITYLTSQREPIAVE